MNATPPQPVPAANHAEPSFWLALRGVCQLAWKAQWTWKRLPVRVIVAFVLPLLAYLVVPTPEQWQARHSILGDPLECVNPYLSRLDRDKIPLENESRVKLRNIFKEEYSRAEGQLMNSRVATQPVATQPVATQPMEILPVEIQPVVETQPIVETLPIVETQPVVTLPVEILPVEIVPMEIQPVVITQPMEIQPAATQPVETQVPATKEAQRVEVVNACFERIQSRAKVFLGKQQFKSLKGATNRAGDRARQRAQEKMGNWTDPFYNLLLDFYFFIVLPLECVRQCGGLIREEAQAGTLSFLATRPLSRARLLVAKYLAQVGWLQATLLAQTLLLFIVGWLRHIPELGTLLPLFLGAQVLAIFAWSALGIFLGQATSRYMAMALVYGTVIELGVGRIPTNINALSMMRHLKTLLAHNAELQNLYEWSGTGVLFSLSAMVIGTALFLSLAAALYSWLEYHHVSEMQK